MEFISYTVTCIKKEMISIQNKVVVITGSNSGIGKALTQNFVKSGAVVFGLDIDSKNGVKLENELGIKFNYIKTDISKYNDVLYAQNIIKSKYKKVDILINNAAIQIINNFNNIKVEDFKRVINVNLVGCFICSKLLVEMMEKSGTIINMLSIHSKKPRTNKLAYDISKAGVEMLAKEMALELIQNNIHVLGVSFGACDTPMNKDWINDIQKRNETLNKIPLRRIASADEIAQFVICIIENFSEYTTGNIFTIDGGRSLI